MEKYLPKISIVTATYNSARTLEQAMTSVLCQTYPNIEYIIIDGGSTDGTVDIIKKYADHIAYWVSEPDCGIYNAFNKGAAVATGEYVEYLGSDDALAGSQVIAQIVPYLGEDVDILSAQEWLVYGASGRQELMTNTSARERASYHGGMIPHGAMFTRRALLAKYPFDEHYRIASDYKFFLQCYYDPTVRFCFIDDIVAFFDAEGGASAQRRACIREDKQIYEELDLPFDDDRDRPLYKKVLLSLAQPFHLETTLRHIYHTQLCGVPHHCDNPVCRWCHRGT